MHRIWLDTNVLLDYLLRRTGFETPAIALFRKIEKKEVMAFTSIVNLIHAHYQLRKITTERAARGILENLNRLIHIQKIPPDIANRALSNLFITDFEDAVQYELALLSKADFLLTRNLTDFASGIGPVVCSVEHYLVFFQQS